MGGGQICGIVFNPMQIYTENKISGTQIPYVINPFLIHQSMSATPQVITTIEMGWTKYRWQQKQLQQTVHCARFTEARVHLPLCANTKNPQKQYKNPRHKQFNNICNN